MVGNVANMLDRHTYRDAAGIKAQTTAEVVTKPCRPVITYRERLTALLDRRWVGVG